MSNMEQIKKDQEILNNFECRVNNLVQGTAKDFIKAIWDSFIDYSNVSLEYRWRRYHHFNSLHDTYQKLCGFSASNCRTLDEFFCPNLTFALETFFGPEETRRISDECALILEFPYSHSIYRPSYRSKKAGDYADTFFMAMINAIDFACYNLSTEQSLITKNAFLSGLNNRIALALRQGDEKIFDLVKEAVLGDNSIVQMSNMIISAIVRSGESRSLELLGKLLLAAKGQEGLRQAILETCDNGTLFSHIYFIRLILENSLCRFSSVVRAFDTWAGLAFGDQKQKTAEKCMALALKYLSDESLIEPGLDFADTTEIYMALWALSCRDIHRASESAHRLLNDSKKYKRLVGWYFITNTNNETTRHLLASSYLDTRNSEELAWICLNLYQNHDVLRSHYRWDEEAEQLSKSKAYHDETYPSDKSERISLFSKVSAIVEFIGKKTTKFAESVFPWYDIELTASQPIGCLIGLTGYDRSPELTLSLANYLPFMNSNQRLCFYSSLLNPEIPEQRALLLNGLSDKSPTVKERIVMRLGYYTLTKTDTTCLTEALTTLNADLRKEIMILLGKQNELIIRPVIDSLLNSKNKNQMIAGIELLDIFAGKNPLLKSSYHDKIFELKSDETLSHDVSILLERLVLGENSKDEYTAENGYGLFNPSANVFNCDAWENKRPQVPLLNNKELNLLIVPDTESILALYERITGVFNKFSDYEYETECWNGTREKVLLNDDKYGIRLLAGKTSDHTGHDYSIEDYPLADEWLKAAGEYASDKPKLSAVLSLWSKSYRNNKVYTEWFQDIFAGYPIDSTTNPVVKKITEYVQSKNITVNKANQILNAILNTGNDSLFDFAFKAYVNLIRKVPKDKLKAECEEEGSVKSPYHTAVKNKNVLSAEYLCYWKGLAYRYIENDKQFSAYFDEIWYEYLACEKQSFYGLSDKDICRAHNLGLISDDAVYSYFTTAHAAADHIRFMTGTGKASQETLLQYPAAKNLLETAIDRIVTIEENRGEVPTSLTKVASQINRFNGGTQHFVKLLAALGDTGFHRGYTYYYSNNGELTKKESLSQLLRRCRPLAEDTPKMLCDALHSAKIPEKRVIQAAVYAPQWAGLLEQAMEITGLKCGVWFFHAHISERFSAEKETETAIFSSISPQQFKDGTFDKDWFFEAYNALGEKRFNELYKNAKYITDSSSAHRRSQLYADAVLGRMDMEAAKSEIIAKRSQEKLRAFALIPLDNKIKNDALTRYEFIQQFKKESRQFGSQRQASEGKACQIAMENLAITTGYVDTDRMTWALEGEKIDQLRPLMEPHTIGGAEVWLSIADDGTPDLNIRKKGKQLKTLPKELAKDPYIIDLKESVKQLRDQKRRANLSFEMSMVSRTQFNAAEITGLLNHPVLRGMVSALVFVSGSTIGFPILLNGNTGLTDILGEFHLLSSNDKLIVAHPYDFINNKCFSDYQRYIYQNQIVQPFKQVFREYYPVTEDEINSVNVSRRYAGNQVQPKKTVALLKTRGWTVDYEQGLQRVWHKENLIARIYAMADWFSPADIEPPALETVCFYSRDKMEQTAFTDITPIIFSETMRDIDLAVSVAHAGGVDPEASHSTVEMRIAISRELLSMLSVKNVKFQKAHAQIQGSLGDYSIHMGSGTVHKSGTGMLAVLPVHSQARGRIFLPFTDDDPKTAEILSKILLFADDKKIKDPSILSQIEA